MGKSRVRRENIWIYRGLNMKLLGQFAGWVLSVLLILAGCATPSSRFLTVNIHHPTPAPPPTPSVNPSLLEGETTVTGSGVPHARVDILLNGGPITKGTIAANGHFDLEVSSLTADQVVTATQTVTGQTSAPSLPVIVKRAILTQIEINPASPMTIKQGQTLPFTVSGLFSNGRTEVPLPGVTWFIESPTVATIDADGMATGVDVGTTRIQATRGSVQSAHATLTVQPLPPVITSFLKAGDSIVAGSADPLAHIQLLKNGVPLDTQVFADAQGQWQAHDLPSLTEQDQVTSTQMINRVQSAPSTVVKVLPNSPPVFASLSNQKIQLGETLSMKLTATDPDGDVLTFQATPQPLPANSKLDTTTGLLTFTPAADQVGTIPLTFRVSDGYSGQEKTINIDVVLPKAVIILLDNPDGAVGMIHVTSAGETRVLDKTGQAIRLGSPTDPPSEPFMLKGEIIQDSFKQALEATPEDPLKFTLYFEADTTKLSSESRQRLPEILAIIASREVLDIAVIGHSDRMASDEYNHQLSLRRATTIRDSIVTGGIDPHVIEVTGHGENNPLVDTADDVSEPLNRRVEIIIR